MNKIFVQVYRIIKYEWIIYYNTSRLFIFILDSPGKWTMTFSFIEIIHNWFAYALFNLDWVRPILTIAEYLKANFKCLCK